MTTPTIRPERLAQLEQGIIRLDKGGHPDFETGHCAMEVVAYLAGEGHTDAPDCASNVLRSFTINLNDQWDTEQRQKLAPPFPAWSAPPTTAWMRFAVTSRWTG